jgi:hypothetical protein
MASSILTALARAYMERERNRLGIPQAAQATQAAATTDLLRRAQAAKLAQELDLAPAAQESKIGLEGALATQAVAHGQSYLAGKPLSVGNANAVVDDNGTVVGYVGTKPGPDGRLPRYDTTGRPVGVQPTTPAAESVASQRPLPNLDEEAGGSAPPTPSTPSAPPPPPPSFPSTFHTKAKPQPRQPPQPSYMPATDASGNAVWVDRRNPAGTSPPQTQVERTRRDQAAHVISQGTALLQELDRPEVQAVMGPRAGLWTGFKDTAIGGALTGGAPPEATHLASATASLSAFLPIMHGMRGGENMIAHFEHVLGKQGELAIRRNPAAVKGAVTALIESARRIREQGDNADLTDIAPSPGAAPAAGGFRVIGVRP